MTIKLPDISHLTFLVLDLLRYRTGIPAQELSAEIAKHSPGYGGAKFVQLMTRLCKARWVEVFSIEFDPRIHYKITPRGLKARYTVLQFYKQRFGQRKIVV